MTERTPKGRPSGSDKRQRQQKASARFTADELATLEAAADAVGLSVAGFIRLRCLGTLTPRTQNPPGRDTEAISKLGAQLGKIGSNLNQLTRLGNQGQIVPPSSLASCLAHVDELLEKLDEVFKYDY